MLTRRKFLKRGLIFVPASGLIRKAFAQGMTISDGPFMFAGGAGCGSQAEVTAWVNRITAAGGTAPSQAIQDAHCAFIDALKAASIWTAFSNGYLNTVYSDAQGYLIPLVKGRGSNQWTPGNGGAFGVTVNGFKGDGTTGGWIDTGATRYKAGTDATTYTMIVYTSVGNSNNEQDGGGDNGDPNHGFNCTNFGGSLFFDCTNNANAGRITGVNSMTSGYMCGTRVSATDQRVFLASSTHAHAQFGSTNTNNITLGDNGATTAKCCCYDGNGARSGFSTRRYSCLGLATGFSATDSLNFYNAIQTLRTAMGGGAV